MNINNIRANMIKGGARPTQFEVIITNPVSSVADIRVPFMVKATQIPGHSHGRISIPYFGRRWDVPGDRVNQDWTTVVMNDETFDIRNALETWSNAMNSQQGNISTLGSEPGNYLSQATVRQYGKDGQVIRVYELHDIWPMEISPIELSWESTDTIEEFTVTWAVRDIEIVGGITGDAGGI